MRRRFSQEGAWLALASIAALSMLPLYHRLHDTSLLLLAFPAFAMLWAKGGPTSWLALLFTGAGAVFTGDFPVQILAIQSAHLRASTPGLPGDVLTLALARPVPLVLLAMGILSLRLCEASRSGETRVANGKRKHAARGRHVKQERWLAALNADAKFAGLLRAGIEIKVVGSALLKPVAVAQLCADVDSNTLCSCFVPFASFGCVLLLDRRGIQLHYRGHLPLRDLGPSATAGIASRSRSS